MSTFTRPQGIAAVLALTFLSAAAASDTGIPIYVRLVDRVGLSPKLRNELEATVQAIFEKAGLSLAFVDCSGAPDPKDYFLQILNLRPKHLPPDSTGSTVLVRSAQPGDSYAAIWFPEVESAALSLDAPVASVLAATIAHEMGHLLLHSSGHSPSGVMSPRMDRRQIRLLERGELLFTPAQSASFRSSAYNGLKPSTAGGERHGEIPERTRSGSCTR
jgi:hypothetical protein